MALHGFRRTLTGRIVVRLDEVERELLRSLLAQLVEFVAPAPRAAHVDPLELLIDIDPDAVTPADPALARLLPAGYGTDDPIWSAEFRRFTERPLREAKLANAATAVASLERAGDKMTLTTAEAQSWLASLNDLRLTLGTRLDITDDRHEMSANDEVFGAYHIYDWLTYLQETLVQAVMSTDLLGPPRR